MRLRGNRSRVLVFALFILFILPGRASAQAPYDSLITFGDSLSDTGNVFILSSALGIDPAPPPSISPHQTYFAGRFSNGPVAFEYLWQMISGKAPGSPGALRPFLASPLHLTAAVDFSFGGTGTEHLTRTPGGFFAPGLKGQIELYRAVLRGRRPSRRTLFAIVTGANDYRDDAFHQPLPPTEVVNNIREAVETLYEIGARNVAVLNLPDLGLLPANQENPVAATQLSIFHNTLLTNALNQLAAELPRLNLVQVDLFQVPGRLPPEMNRMVPALDVLIPPDTLPGYFMSTCLFINPVLCTDVPTFDVGILFLFWDVVHPTTAAHRVLGEYVFERVSD